MELKTKISRRKWCNLIILTNPWKCYYCVCVMKYHKNLLLRQVAIFNNCNRLLKWYYWCLGVLWTIFCVTVGESRKQVPAFPGYIPEKTNKIGRRVFSEQTIKSQQLPFIVPRLLFRLRSPPEFIHKVGLNWTGL